MSNHNPADNSVFIDEVHGQIQRKVKLLQFTHSATKAAAVMLLAAIVSLAIANSGLHEPFLELVHTKLGIVVGDWRLIMSAGHFINDLLMALFFLLVGLEIKYEMTVGELTNVRNAVLPILAACGGVLVPVLIFVLFNLGSPETIGGWGVPTATDIAFALGIMSLLGDRIPNGIKVFLSTLAVADDIIAILVIAVFYGHTPDFAWLAGAGVILALLLFLNHKHVYALSPYLALGTVLWFCVYQSGVHSTIAGVLVAFAIPSGSQINLHNFGAWSRNAIKKLSHAYNPDEHILAQKDYLHGVSALTSVASKVTPPAVKIEHGLYPWVYFLFLPLFALTNADVSLAGANLAEILSSPVFLGVFLGLVVGKPAGILLFSLMVVKTRLAPLPAGVTWRHMIGAAVLGGVGFTMAIFVSNLAFSVEAYVAAAKLAILIASLCAGVIGFLLLYLEAKRS